MQARTGREGASSSRGAAPVHGTSARCLHATILMLERRPFPGYCPFPGYRPAPA